MSGSEASTTPVRVLFVAGYGRSGSTVLDTVLGNHPSMIGLGELGHLGAAGWRDDEYCACGARVGGCPFWSAVRRRWIERLDRDDLPGALRAQQVVERRRSWPRLERWARREAAVFARYAEDQLALFRAIRDVSGAVVLVDSSKHPARGLALAHVPGLDVRVVHLIRDGRGVAWSLRRGHRSDPSGGVARDLRQRPVVRSALAWTAANWLAERLAATVGTDATMRLRYEDFLTDPATALADLGRLVDLDLVELGRRAAAQEAFAVGHTVAGNRLRMRGSLRLRLDEAWRDEMPARERRWFALTAGPMLRRYGYR